MGSTQWVRGKGEGANRSTHWGTSHHLPAALANHGCLGWLQAGKSTRRTGRRIVENCSPASLTSVPERSWSRLNAIIQNVQSNQRTRHSQQGSMKGRSCCGQLCIHYSMIILLPKTDCSIYRDRFTWRYIDNGKLWRRKWLLAAYLDVRDKIMRRVNDWSKFIQGM